jgi:hypothetical protein
VATKWCMSCGSEYVVSVTMCPDCDVELVDRDLASDAGGTEAEADAGAEPGGQIRYELHEWAGESRVLLEQLLEAEAVPRAWQGAVLLVPAASEGVVDALVDQVIATTLPTLDPDAAKLVYELEDWDEAEITRLAEALDTLEIPYELDIEGNLVVLEDDEERIETLLESIEYPDALKPDTAGDDEIDGVDVADVLGKLFVAADRLKNHARDHEGVLGLVRAADLIAGIPVPFGFAPAVWTDIVGQAERLRVGIENDEQTDEEIEEHAEELRALLRSYV